MLRYRLQSGFYEIPDKLATRIIQKFPKEFRRKMLLAAQYGRGSLAGTTRRKKPFLASGRQ